MGSKRAEGRILPAHDSVRALAAAEFVHSVSSARRARTPARPQIARRRTQRWQALRSAGSSVWLDRADLDEWRAVWAEEFRGLTTDNMLLDAQVQKGTYDDVIPQAAAALRRADPAVDDGDLVVDVAHVLSALFAQAFVDEFGGDVSIELHTGLAHDADASYACGRSLHAICPAHFVIKIPLTPAGLLATRRLAADGVRVDCTLAFSPRQSRLIADFAQPHFVDVLVGRIDRLAESGGVDLPSSAGIASTLRSQRMLDAWHANRPTANRVRLMAASLRSNEQIRALAGVDVLTVPRGLAAEIADGDAVPFADRTAAAPREVELEPLRAAGLDVFWETGDLAAVAGRQFELREPDSMDAERTRAILHDNGLGSLFPDLAGADRERLVRDGRIPRWDAWRERVAAGEASWDGLLTEAGLASFASAQTEIDQRIRELI